MKIFIYSTYPFLLQPRFLPTQPSFNQDAKPSPGKGKKCFLEAPYGTSQTSKLLPFTKKLTAYSRKQFPQKKST